MKRISLFLFTLWAAFFLLGASSCSSEDSQVAVADDLIDAFSQGCSLGPWTRAALERSASITAVYESLLEKASCKGNPNLQRAIVSAQAIQAEIRAMEADQIRSSERKLDEASNDLLLALSKPGLDADIKEGLIDYYTKTRYELSMARAEASYVRNPGYKSRMTYGMTQVNSHMRNLLAASKELTACYKDNPSVAMEVGASILELAGSFAAPVVGLGISAIAGLIQVAVEAARTFPAAEAIYESRRTRMPIALSCGLETLTRDYCRARDARTLVDVSLRQKNKTEALPFFQGIILQDRYLPELYQWLDRVVNGGDEMRDSDQADRINLQFNRLNRSQSMRRSAQGVIAEAQAEVEGARSASERVSSIRKAIRRLLDVFFQCSNGRGDNFSCSDGIFYEVESSQSFVRKIAGERAPNQNFNDVSQLVDALTLQANDLPMVIDNLEALIQVRYASIVQEFNEKVNVDLPSLVRAATTVNKEELSPFAAFEKLFHFFSQYAFEPGVNGQKDQIIIAQVKDKVEKVYLALKDPNSVSEVPVEIPCEEHSRGTDENGQEKKCYDVSPAAKTVAITYETFKLDKNNVFLPGVLKGLVQTDLTTRYLRGEGPKEIEDLYRLAGGDLSLLIERSGLTPARVRLDLDRAQSLSSNNLRQFRSFFAPSIRVAMEDLKKAADENGEPAAGQGDSPNRNVLSQLCMLTLISGITLPEGVDAKLCEGTMLVSKEAGLRLRFEEMQKKLEGKPLHDRMCEYEEFLRLDRLANLDLKRPGGQSEGFVEKMLARVLGSSKDESKRFFQRVLEQP